MASKDLVAYSQSRAMLAIIKASFQAILANPSALVFSIAFPILFVLIFGAFDKTREYNTALLFKRVVIPHIFFTKPLLKIPLLKLYISLIVHL